MVALFNSFVSGIRTKATQSLRHIIRRLLAIISRRTLMHHRLALLCMLSCTLGPAAYAAATAGCDDKLMYTLRHLQLVVGTLREALANRSPRSSLGVTKLLVQNNIEVAEMPVTYRTFRGFTRVSWRMRHAWDTAVSLLQ